MSQFTKNFPLIKRRWLVGSHSDVWMLEDSVTPGQLHWAQKHPQQQSSRVCLPSAADSDSPHLAGAPSSSSSIFCLPAWLCSPPIVNGSASHTWAQTRGVKTAFLSCYQLAPLVEKECEPERRLAQSPSEFLLKPPPFPKVFAGLFPRWKRRKEGVGEPQRVSSIRWNGCEEDGATLYCFVLCWMSRSRCWRHTR